MYTFELLSALSSLYSVIIALFVLFLANTYIQKLLRQKKLDFTQKFIFNNNEILLKIRNNIASQLDSDNNNPNYYTEENFFETYLMLSFANEIALGIDCKLYDSELLRSTYHQDLVTFYKLNYKKIDNFRIRSNFDLLLFRVEKLFHNWENPKTSKRRF